MKKSNYSYIGISFIILVFGIYFIPKIIDRINHDDISRDESRTDYVKEKKAAPSDLVYIEINGKKKMVL